MLLVWFGFDNLGYLLVLLAAAALFLFAGFAALTSTGPMRVMALITTLVAVGVLVAATAIRFASLGHVRGTGLAALLCLVVAVSCGRYALRVPPPSGDAVWAVPSRGPSTRHGVVIANPASGGGKVGSCGLEAVAREHGIELVIMERGDDPADLARDAVRRGADALGMAGGDGSLAQVAQVAVDHDLPFVVVPAGTRNHYALDLGLDRNDPTLALAAFVRGDEHRVDYATVNGRMFLNNVSLGVYAAAVEQPEYRDAKLETTLKLLPDLVEKGGPCFDLHVDVPEQGRWESAALIQVSNGVYEMAGSAFGRRLHLDEGELGVVAVDISHGADLAAITVLAAAQAPRAPRRGVAVVDRRAHHRVGPAGDGGRCRRRAHRARAAARVPGGAPRPAGAGAGGHRGRPGPPAPRQHRRHRDRAARGGVQHRRRLPGRLDTRPETTRTTGAVVDDFGGRTGAALVTGGSGGIGAAICRMLAERGSSVAFTYRANAAAAEALEAELRAFGVDTWSTPLDLVDEAAAAAVVAGHRRALRGAAHARARRRSPRAPDPPEPGRAVGLPGPDRGRGGRLLQRPPAGPSRPARGGREHRGRHHRRHPPLPGP